MLGDGAEFFVYFFFFFFFICLSVCFFVFFLSYLFKKNICYFIVCSLMIVVCGYGLLVYTIKFVVMVWWLLFMLLHLLVGYMYV